MAEKAARKTPVRKAPARKDYPTEVAWLHAKLEYAESTQRKENESKVARFDKRIASKLEHLDKLTVEIDTLRAERNKLLGIDPVEPMPAEGTVV